MRDVLDRGDRTAIAVLVHDAGIERDLAVAIRIARAPDAVVAQIRLRHARAGLDRVERAAALARTSQAAWFAATPKSQVETTRGTAVDRCDAACARAVRFAASSRDDAKIASCRNRRRSVMRDPR